MSKLLNIFKKCNMHSVYRKPYDLLIVGNGFDLRCGLDSTFSNFFKLEFKNNLKNYTNINGFKHFMSLNVNEYLYGRTHTTKELTPLILGGINRMMRLIHVKDNSDLYGYIHYLIATIMSYHYQLLGNEDNYNKYMNCKTFYRSDLFHLLIYVYFLKKYATNATLFKKLPHPNEKYRLIKCFMLLFYNNINKEHKRYKLNNNFWMFYFGFILSLKSLKYNNKDLLTWSDIENHLKNFLVDYSDQIYKYLYYIKKFIRPLSQEDVEWNNCGNNIDLGKQLYKTFYTGNTQNGNDKFFILNIFTIFLILCGIYNCKSIKWLMHDNDKSYYYEFLYNQLYRFEDLFSGYIKKLLYNSNKKHNDNSYNSIAPEIINEILPYHKHPFNLISFNYVPINKSMINKYDGNELIKGNNIHSTIRSKEHPNGHPVFGISKYYCKQGNNIAPYIIFSKSYRVKDSKRNLALPKNVNNIIFFGHSFGSVDYPYFQWIFNKYSICTSNIKLIFCYSVHDDHGNNLTIGDKDYLKCKKNCHKTQVKSVKKLIYKYSSNKRYKSDLYKKLFSKKRIIYCCI